MGIRLFSFSSAFHSVCSVFMTSPGSLNLRNEKPSAFLSVRKLLDEGKKKPLFSKKKGKMVELGLEPRTPEAAGKLKINYLSRPE